MKLADIFQDGAVLQRGKESKIWGEDPNGTHVKAVLKGKTSVIAETSVQNGKFMLTFPAMEAQKDVLLKLVNDRDEVICLKDLAVGEVWIAGGQSNMEFRMAWDAERDNILSEYENTMIRFYETPKISYEGALEEENHSTEGVWRKAVPDEIPYFSAVGFYFANKLQKEFEGVPMGIIGCNWGGTSVSCWMPEEDLVSEFQVYIDLKDKTRGMDLEKEFETFKKRRADELSPEQCERLDLLMKNPIVEPQPPMNPTPEMEAFMALKYAPFSAFSAGNLYQTMLKKIVPYTCAGVIWYQGEEDSLPEYGRKYDRLFAKMIERWRMDWQEELPFIFAQLAGFTNPGGKLSLNFTQVRADQELASKAVKDAWMAVTYDVGLQYDIHPKQKRPVGERMALQALHHVYGKEQLSESPDVTAVRKEEGLITLEMIHTGDGLCLAGEDEKVKGLELTVNGRSVENYSTVVNGNLLQIQSDQIHENSCISLRYAWKDWIETNVYSSAGLPLRPLKIDC